MAGTSIAGPDAALWVTHFLNAAYYARPREDRDVDDLRLAFCILSPEARLARAKLGALTPPVAEPGERAEVLGRGAGREQHAAPVRRPGDRPTVS
jgi:hypothetical protein